MSVASDPHYWIADFESYATVDLVVNADLTMIKFVYSNVTFFSRSNLYENL